MAFYDFYDQRGGYDTTDMGYRNYYGRENYRQPYFDHAAPGMYRRGGGRRYYSEPYGLENYRRDYRHGGGYTDGRFGFLPPEEVVRRVPPPLWTDDGYRRHQGGYRIDRRDFHGGQNYGHGNFLHLQDGGDLVEHRQELELYVPLCCDKCERKLRKHMEYLPGVENITMDQTTKKVTVFGNVNPLDALNRARLDKPESDFWHPRYR